MFPLKNAALVSLVLGWLFATSGLAQADQVIQFPAGGAEDLLHQTQISEAVKVPVDRDEPVCIDLRGKRYRKGDSGYKRCRKTEGIRTAPGAPQGVPGVSHTAGQTSGGITIKTH